MITKKSIAQSDYERLKNATDNWATAYNNLRYLSSPTNDPSMGLNNLTLAVVSHLKEEEVIRKNEDSELYLRFERIWLKLVDKYGYKYKDAGPVINIPSHFLEFIQEESKQIA